MAWEERSGRWYYYKKERTPDGRVVSKYLGKGELAQLIGQVTRGRRLEREAERAHFEEAKAEHRAQRRAVQGAQEAVRALERAVLLASGYRTHRGQWRRQRGTRRPLRDDPSETEPFQPDEPDMGQSDSDAHIIELEESDRKFAKLIERVDTGDPSRKDRKALRKALRETPGLWRRIMSITRYNEKQVIRSMVGKNALLTESVRRGVEEMKEELGHAEAPALERLLIDQIALCWLHLQETQRRYANCTRGQYRLIEAEHWEKRVSAAQRRYLRAVKTLARIRKMAGREVLQINIGGQHVNVAG